MTIRIATFNAENLFRRPRAFALEDDAARDKILADFNELVALLEKETYQQKDKDRMVELIKEHQVHNSEKDSPRPFFINQLKGAGAKLFQVDGPVDNPTIVIKADGRGKWPGWAELVRGDLSWTAVQNTARVVAEVNADVLLMVEVEDRLTLERFNEHVLGEALGHQPYPFNLLVDGNDPRGIDVGILSRHPITSVRSHIFDPGQGGMRLFSRDCPEFEIALNGTPLWILGNHFKSMIGGGAGLRKRQAERVREIYEAALQRSERVVVAGDLNDVMASTPVKKLLDAGLKDAMTHPTYTGDPGTHGPGTGDDDKLDYLMFSPKLWDRVEHVEVERRGIWAPRTFKSFQTVTSKATQASDHAAVYADLDL
ncbi:endonuclease/exonuclease/phosphatase family protein [Streptomyces shaanxiensis]|uniref:Endonuclease/exonuclease/phosphatase domain-containing protein n=1 Tax=Streptomyces shaanxiensis TaxID=653357 RepID=A0ABP7URR1_9ACTN